MKEDSYTRVLLRELRQYIDFLMQYVKILVIEKLSYILAAVVFILLTLFIAAISACYLSLSLLNLLQIYVGTPAAYAIVGVVMLLCIVLLYVRRKQWLLDPITRRVVKIIIDMPSNERKEQV